MRIEKICISNWRSIKRIDMPVYDLMVVIGQNNHGKSNLLSALLFFFGEVKHQDLDFNYGATELYVELTFGSLDQNDRTTFKKYVSGDGRLTVRKTAQRAGSFQYQGYIENPKEEWLQEANASAYTKRELAASLPFHPFIPASGKLAKQDIMDAQQKYLELNRSQTEFVVELEQTNFLGLKSVAKGMFGEVYFIPAVKEAMDDFSSAEKSAFGKMYSEVISAIAQDNADWKATRERLVDLFGALNRLDSSGQLNQNRPAQLSSFEEELTRELVFGGAQIDIDIEVVAPDIEDVFKANTQVWVNDGVRTDITRKGHGLQRALIVALVRVISNRARQTELSQTTSSRTASQSRYFIFEEPELYLHPQAQRSLFDSFVTLSESGSQVILCTHSSGLVDVERYKSICIVLKENESEGSKVKYCATDLFLGDEKKDFNLSYWINPDRSELFFARKVILVEGATDKTVIPHLAKTLGIFRYDYTVIDCGSKDNIPQYIRLLNCFSIPYVAVYDKDHQSGRSADAITSADKSTKAIQEKIVPNLGKAVVLENDIEEEIGLESSDRSKPYLALTHVSSSQFQLSASFKSKINTIYS